MDKVGEGNRKIKMQQMVLHCCLLLLVCMIAGGVLITIANYLPVSESKKERSLAEIESEGLFPEIPSMQGNDGSFQSMNPTALELATDSLMLKMALYQGENQGIIQAFRCYSTQYEEEYSRYWHGYVVILRVLLLFFDYYEIRILNGIFQCCIFVMAAFYIWRQKGAKYALALATSYLLLMPMALAQCLQYSWVYYIAFGALLIYVKHHDYWDKGNRYIYLFLLTGVVTSYLDLLTYPLLTWGLLIVWWILLQEREKTAIGFVGRVAASAISWIAGYAGMWAGKWVLGSVVLRENLFRKAISEAFLWTVKKGDFATAMQERFHAIYLNWSTYSYKIYLIILTAWLCYWVIKGFLSGCRKSPKAPALLLISCASIVWYLVLAGHAQMHHIFTHRIASVSIAAFLGGLLSTDHKFEYVKGMRRLAGYAAALIGIGAFAIFLMFQIKDEYRLHNGANQFEKIEMEAPVSMTFTPVFSNVTILDAGFTVENATEGYCRIQLLDGDAILEECLLPVSDCREGNLHEIDTGWTVKAGHPYTLSLEMIDSDGQAFLWITSDGQMPLSEFGEAAMGEKQLSGQMLAAVTYWCRLVDPRQQILYTITFMAICMMSIYACWSAAGRLRSPKGIL